MAGVLLAGLTLQSHAQVNAIDSVMNHVKGNKLSVGGYGEVGYTREFFSDNPYKYSQAAKYKKDPSHGKFDIPHAVIYLGYDFGKGWTMGKGVRRKRRMGTRGRERWRSRVGTVLDSKEFLSHVQSTCRPYRCTYWLD